MVRASTVNTAIHRDCTDAFEQTHRETARRVGSALSVLTLAHSMTFTLKQQFWVNLVTLVMRHFILGSILQAIEFFHHEMQFKKQTTWKSCNKSHYILVSAVYSLSFIWRIMSLRYWMKNTTKRNELRTEFRRKRGWKVLLFLFDYTLDLSVSQVLDSMLKAILSKPLFFMKSSLHQDTFCFSIAFSGCLIYLYYVWLW